MVRDFHNLLILSITCLLITAGSVVAQDDTAPAEPPPVDTPAVLTIKESNPQSAAELTRAAELMMNLGRDDLALSYLKLLMANAPKPEDWVAAHKLYGSGIYIKFQSTDSLQPEGTLVAEAALKAVSDYAQDPVRIKQFVQDLGSDESIVRQKAVAELKRAQQGAINPLLSVLADPAQAALHPAVESMLLSLNNYSEGPLLAALESDNQAFVAKAISLLNKLNSRTALSLIVSSSVADHSSDEVKKIAAETITKFIGSVPNKEEAKKYLYKRIGAYTAGTPMFEVDHLGEVTFWSWDSDKQEAVENRIPSEDASVLVAARLASDLAQLEPGNQEYKRLHLVTALQSAKYLGGLDKSVLDTPAAQLALDAGFPAIEDVLSYSFGKPNYLAATIAACELLGTADADILYNSQGRPAPLAQALTHGNYLVRVTAAKSIMQLDPQKPYPGSSALTETLVYMANATGRRIIVIGEPHLERAEEMAGLLYELGLEPIVTRGGRAMFQAAYSTPDVEIIFLSDAVNYPIAMESLQILRRDRRSADIPIGFISQLDKLEHLQRRVSDDRLTQVMVRPHDTEGLTYRIQELYKAQGRFLVSAETRLENATQAIKDLQKLTTNPEKYSFYRILELEDQLLPMLELQNVTSMIAPLAGEIASPDAQLALLDIASDVNRPLADRQACAKAFETAVSKRGLLLTKTNVLRQYDRYNASEGADRETQQVLSGLLDSIEKPSKGKRLDQPALPN